MEILPMPGVTVFIPDGSNASFIIIGPFTCWVNKLRDL